jgi:hypothetical protein
MKGPKFSTTKFVALPKDKIKRIAIIGVEIANIRKKTTNAKMLRMYSTGVSDDAITFNKLFFETEYKGSNGSLKT